MDARNNATAHARNKNSENDNARQEALRDVYGIGHAVKNVDEGEAMLDSARKQLEEAMRMLPHEGDLRQAYDEAMLKCPHLVEMESNAATFLRVVGYDPWAAAQRIALYWKWRKAIFRDRAFYPMMMTQHTNNSRKRDSHNNGTLCAEDVEVLESGCFFILPPDQHNRPIFFTDRGRRYLHPNTRSRLMFYMLHVLSESHLGQAHGIVGMNAFSKHSPANNRRVPKIFQLFQSEAIPVKVNACHMLVFEKESILSTCLSSWLTLAEQLGLFPMRIVAHFCESETHVMSKLRPYGFLEHNIPTEMGGQLNLDQEFRRWFAERVQFEQKRYGAILSTTSHGAAASLGTATAAAGANSSLPAEKNLSVLACAVKRVREEDAKSRHRKVCRLYQQKKREQFKQEKVQLEAQIREKETEKADLSREHHRLDRLWELATKFVQDYETEQREQQLQKQLQQQTNKPTEFGQHVQTESIASLVTDHAPQPAPRDATTTAGGIIQQAPYQPGNENDETPCSFDQSALLEQLQQKRMQNALLVQMVEQIASQNLELARQQKAMNQRMDVLLQQQQQQHQSPPQPQHCGVSSPQMPAGGGVAAVGTNTGILQGMIGQSGTTTAAAAAAAAGAWSIMESAQSPLIPMLLQNPSDMLASLLLQQRQQPSLPLPTTTQQQEQTAARTAGFQGLNDTWRLT